MELEVASTDDGGIYVEMSFVTTDEDDEGEEDHATMLLMIYKDTTLLRETLVAKTLYEDYLATRSAGSWPFDEESEAYKVDDFEKSLNLLEIVFGLLENKEPVRTYEFDFDDEEEGELAPGEVLYHFIALLQMEFTVDQLINLTASQVAECIEMAGTTEGEYFIAELEKDLENSQYDEQEHLMPEEIFDMIVGYIKAYFQKQA